MFFDPLMLVVAVQIIIESIPVSSSGHVLLTQHLLERLGIDIDISLPDYLDHFIHGPTLLIISLYFFNAWWPLLRRLVGCLKAWMRHDLRDSQRRLVILISKIIVLIALAELAFTCILLPLWRFKHAPFMQGLPVLLIGFVITMGLLASLVVRDGCCSSPRMGDGCSGLTYSKAIILGIIQAVVYLLPGVSRFASTFVAARWLGISSRRALQFSFVMFFPLMLSAFVGSGYEMMMHPGARQFVSMPWLLTYGLASIVAYALFALAAGMALRETLWKFAFYMAMPIITAIVLLVH